MSLLASLQVRGPQSAPANVSSPTAHAASVGLLPQANGPLDSIDDAMGMLALTMSKLTNSEASASEKDVKLNLDKAKEKRKEKDDQIAKAKDDANKGGFLDDLMNNSGVLGAVGLITFCPELVAADLILHSTHLSKSLNLDGEDNLVIAAAMTGGGAAVVAGAGAIAARKSGMVDGAADKIGLDGVGDFIRKDHTGLTDEKVRPYMQYLWAADLAVVSLAVTGATFGSGAPLTLAVIAVALSGAAMGVQKTKCMDGVTGEGSSEYWAMGLQAGSLACSLGSAGTGLLAPTTSLAAGASTAKMVSSGMEAGTDVAKGTDQIQRTVHQHDADMHMINAKRAEIAAARHQRIVNMVIDGIKESKKSNESAMKSLQGAMETKNQTAVTVGAMRG